MQTDNTGAEVTSGYMKAVGAATLAFGLQLLLFSFWVHATSANPLQWASIGELLSMGGMFVLGMMLFAIATTLLAAIPFLITVQIAKWLDIKSVAYYVVCGTATAAVLSPLCLLFDGCRSTELADCPGPEVWKDSFYCFRFWILPSIVGAVAFWASRRSLR